MANQTDGRNSDIFPPPSLASRVQEKSTATKLCFGLSQQSQKTRLLVTCNSEVNGRRTVELWCIQSDATISIGNNRKKKQVHSKAQIFKNHSVFTACFIVTNAWSARGTSSGAIAVRLSTYTDCAHHLLRTSESFEHRQQHRCRYCCCHCVRQCN